MTSPFSAPIALALLALPAVAQQSELEELRARVRALEERDARPPSLDLGGDELDSIAGLVADDPLARAWFDNFTLSGYVAAGYFDSGGTGLQRDGDFFVDQASLEVAAAITENASAFFELQAVRWKYDYDKYFRTGEVYLHLHDFHGVGVKVGRFDLPFGEEYVWVDAPRNPLISHTAAQVYGMDEGVLVHGDLGELRWVTALTAGSNDRSQDDDPSKLVSARLSGEQESWRWSVSLAHTGESDESPFLFGGKTMRPVGAKYASTNGASPSDKVSVSLAEFDAVTRLTDDTEAEFAFGHGKLDDDVSAFDRDLTWFHLQGVHDLGDGVSLALRYSEAGTYDGDEGYTIDGMNHALGRAFGYDVQRLQRLAFGVRWNFQPRLWWKLEVGRDRFELIDASPFMTENNERTFVGIELVAAF